MTYGEIYKKFCETVKNLDIDFDIEDYRPDVSMYMNDLNILPEGAGIRIWMKNGDGILYYPSEVLESKKK